ncbi:MAG: hypothetical protein ACLSUW_04030 [Akkermansia sp.]
MISPAQKLKTARQMASLFRQFGFNYTGLTGRPERENGFPYNGFF